MRKHRLAASQLYDVRSQFSADSDPDMAMAAGVCCQVHGSRVGSFYHSVEHYTILDLCLCIRSNRKPISRLSSDSDHEDVHPALPPNCRNADLFACRANKLSVRCTEIFRIRRNRGVRFVLHRCRNPAVQMGHL